MADHGGGSPATCSTALQGEALVDPHRQVWLPYDLPHLKSKGCGWSPLSRHRSVRHAGRLPFKRAPSPRHEALHIINGMGVTLGDTLIGLNALAWIKACQPGLSIHVYRSRHVPPAVEQLYRLCAHLINRVHYLPVPLDTLPDGVIDLSDFLYWPEFATLPMVDFFMRGLGVDATGVPASAKGNRWMTALPQHRLPSAWAGRPYVLLCDRASTALRCIPVHHAEALVERIWQQYRLPVLGFSRLTHPHYRDISALSPDVQDFFAWISHASVVVGTDSAAIHAAAGHAVPTLAVFVSIDPLLRVRDYPDCTAIDARTPLTNGLHQSDEPALLAEVDGAWQNLVRTTLLPWPEPAQPAPRIRLAERMPFTPPETARPTQTALAC